MIDFSTDPRFNLPEGLNLNNMTVKLIGQNCFTHNDYHKRGTIEVILAMENANTANQTMVMIAGEWTKKTGGGTRYVSDTLVLLSKLDSEPQTFYYIDLLPYNGVPDPGDTKDVMV